MTTALADLRERYLEDGYVFPAYGDIGVADVPDTAAWLLGVDADAPVAYDGLRAVAERPPGPIDHVVVFVIDGLGWHRLQAMRPRYPRLDRLADRALLRPLTSTYPSETAAAMTTLYTGLQPVEHGLLGWFARFEMPTVIGQSLPMCTLEGEPLQEAYGHLPSQLFDVERPTVTDRLQDAGVEVGFVQPAAIADSPVSRLASGGAHRHGYETVDAAFRPVIERLRHAEGRTYHLVYYPDVDAAAHADGVTAPSSRRSVREGIRALEDHFLAVLGDEVAARTAVLVVADHGMVDTDRGRTVDLRHLIADGHLSLEAGLERDEAGDPLYLAGSPRNVQLYTRSGWTDTIAEELRATLAGLVFDREGYRRAGLFGDRRPGERFHARAPDLVFVPERAGVWYDDGTLDEVGMHGGMHPREMVIPLLAGRVDRLRGDGGA